MKKKTPSPPPSEIKEDDVREYAYHLYVQNGCIPGRDLENWLEAEACLHACIPIHLSHTRLHQHLSGASERSAAT